jgi:hypothetical protein
MKKNLSLFLFCISSFISFAQDNKSNDSLQIADTNHTAIQRLIKENDSIILLNARYEDSMRMLFTETNNKNNNSLVNAAEKRKEKTNRQLYFRIGLGVFFLGLLVFRLVKKSKEEEIINAGKNRASLKKFQAISSPPY